MQSAGQMAGNLDPDVNLEVKKLSFWVVFQFLPFTFQKDIEG